MRIHCRRDQLLAACIRVLPSASGRLASAVMQNFKAVAQPHRCTLLATDGEIGIRLAIEGTTVDTPGETLFPAGRITAILRETPDDEIAIETLEQTCKVTGNLNEFELCSEDPATFPDVPSFTETNCYVANAGELKEMIRRTTFAAGTEHVRFALSGVLWELERTRLRMVATDGRRLAMIDGKVTQQGKQSGKLLSAIVPAKAMQLLERNLINPEADVRIHFDANRVIFQIEQATISARLVEGRFPPYRDILMKSCNIRVDFAAGALHAAVRQAAVMADQEARRVRFRFDQNKLTLKAETANSGKARVEMAIEYTTEPLEILFDPRLLIDMLRILDPHEAITLEIKDASSAAAIRVGDGFQYLVMPMA